MNCFADQQAPKISVLMTVFNAGPYLRQAIDSILAQTRCDWELVVVDDGSTDGSAAILTSYPDSRIRAFILPGNIGRTPALRYGFDRARGEYIAVLDADDLAHPERMQKQAAYLDAHPAIGLVGSWAEQIDADGRFLAFFQPPTGSDELHEALGWSNPFVHSSVMYRADLARRVGGYSLEYIYGQDYALILKLEREAPVDILAEPLCKLRVVGTSMSFSSQYTIAAAREALQLVEIAGQREFRSVAGRRRARHQQAVLQLRLGLFLAADHRPWAGFLCACRAVCRAPSCLIKNGFLRAWARRILLSRRRGKA